MKSSDSPDPGHVQSVSEKKLMDWIQFLDFRTKAHIEALEKTLFQHLVLPAEAKGLGKAPEQLSSTEIGELSDRFSEEVDTRAVRQFFERILELEATNPGLAARLTAWYGGEDPDLSN